MTVTRYSVLEGQTIGTTTTDDGRLSLLEDGLGSVLAAVNSTNGTVKTLVYDGYGSVVTETGSVELRHAYEGAVGYYTDSPAMIYVRTRTLDPSMGRWMNRGDISLDMNTYMYARSNPVSYKDPEGLFASNFKKPGRKACVVYCHQEAKRRNLEGVSAWCATICAILADAGCKAAHDKCLVIKVRRWAEFCIILVEFWCGPYDDIACENPREEGAWQPVLADSWII
jgi:RHS repeat-associated protein